MFNKFQIEILEIKSEININYISTESPNIQKLNKTFIPNPQAKEEITRQIRKYFKLKSSENAIHKKCVLCSQQLEGNLWLLNAYIRKEERSLSNDVSSHIQKLDKEEHIKQKNGNCKDKILRKQKTNNREK